MAFLFCFLTVPPPTTPKSEEELRQLADYLINHSRQLYNTVDASTAAAAAAGEAVQAPSTGSDDISERMFQLSSYIDALARMVQALPQLDEDLLAILERLIMLLIQVFPDLYETQRTVAYVALARALACLHLKGGGVLASLFGRVAYFGILQASSRGLQATAEAAAAAAAAAAGEDVDEADSGGSATGEPPAPAGAQVMAVPLRTASMRLYITFFHHIVSGKFLSRVSEEELPADSRPELSRLLYDEVVKALLQQLNKLNLSSITVEDVAAAAAATATAATVSGAVSAAADAALEAEPDLGADPTAHLRPSVPLDFVLLIQLVEFGTAFLRRTNRQFFLRWMYPFTSQVVALSSRYPIVSGFYKLLQVEGRRLCAEDMAGDCRA